MTKYTIELINNYFHNCIEFDAVIKEWIVVIKAVSICRLIIIITDWFVLKISSLNFSDYLKVFNQLKLKVDSETFILSIGFISFKSENLRIICVT